MTTISILKLRSNVFKGRIPLQICQLSFLGVSNPASNSLVRPIANSLKKRTVMAFPRKSFINSFNNLSKYGGYFETLTLFSKGNELEYERCLIFFNIIDFQVTTCLNQFLVKFQSILN